MKYVLSTTFIADEIAKKTANAPAGKTHLPVPPEMGCTRTARVTR